MQDLYRQNPSYVFLQPLLLTVGLATLILVLHLMVKKQKRNMFFEFLKYVFYLFGGAGSIVLVYAIYLSVMTSVTNVFGTWFAAANLIMVAGISEFLAIGYGILHTEPYPDTLNVTQKRVFWTARTLLVAGGGLFYFYVMTFL